jgi:hypothetical protein
MKTRLTFAAAVLAAALPTLALAAPLLTNPADADRDGVVTDEEKADYLAKKAAGVQNTPGLPVAAPKPGGGTVFKPVALSDPDDLARTAAGAPPSQASDFERSVETRIRKDAEDDR